MTHSSPDSAPQADVNELAAYLIALEDAPMYEPIRQSLIDRGRWYINAGSTEEHSGDCTKQCYTCVVCTTSDAIAKAKQILAALASVKSAPAQAAGEPVAWTNEAQLSFLRDPQYARIPMAMWAAPLGDVQIALYAVPPQPAPDISTATPNATTIAAMEECGVAPAISRADLAEVLANVRTGIEKLRRGFLEHDPVPLELNKACQALTHMAKGAPAAPQAASVTSAGSNIQELLVRAETYLSINAADGRGSGLLVMELADALRSLSRPPCTPTEKTDGSQS